MFQSLMPEFLSIKADLPRALELASRHNFDGLDTNFDALSDAILDIDALCERMRRSGVQPGAVSLPPGRVPVPESDWRDALTTLPALARRARRLGFRRAVLVVLPFHETLDFDDAFAEHVRRLNAMTAILDDFQIALGLEYVSPRSRRAPFSCHFVWEIRGMLALCDALKSPDVGLLLDSFHWHCAGETVADIKNLTNKRIVAVHVNDAPPVPIDAQTVGARALPGATGVIDIAGFLAALETIGYDGPITCEPMATAIAALSAQTDDEILTPVKASLDAVWPK